MPNMINTRVQHKYDTAANWTSNNPTLLAGEIGIESDTNKIKIGDGVKNWKNLPYIDDSKLDKVTTTAGNQRAYIITTDGKASTKAITCATLTPDTLIARDANGNIFTGVPTANNHVTTKKYVDDGLALKADDRDTPSLVACGTSIPNGADLNTVDYLKVGNYWCKWTSIANSLLNCPAKIAFKMEVSAPVQSEYDNEEQEAGLYRIRKIIDNNANIWFQVVFKKRDSETTPYYWVYRPWEQVTYKSETDKKLDKVTSTADTDRVYAIASTGTNKVLPVASGATTQYSLVQRNGSGQIVTADPTATYHAATKKYVDDGLLTKASLVASGISIQENDDLNTEAFLAVGNYYCRLSTIAETLTNCPVSDAFMMEVLSPIQVAYNNESSNGNIYRIRKILTYTGIEYIQFVQKHKKTATDSDYTWSYDDWQCIATQKYVDDNLSLKSNKATTPSLLGDGTAIVSNADLNTVDYYKVGNYQAATNDITRTLTNSPTRYAFLMEVSTIKNTYNNEAQNTSLFRIRKITDYMGNCYIQYVTKTVVDGVYTWRTSAWEQMATRSYIDDIVGDIESLLEAI